MLKWLYDRYVEKENFLRSFYDAASASSASSAVTAQARSRESLASVTDSSKPLHPPARRSATTDSVQHGPANDSSNFVDVLRNGLRVPDNRMRDANSSWHVFECEEVKGHAIPNERTLSMDGVYVAGLHFFFIASFVVLGSLYKNIVSGLLALYF